MHPPTPTHSPQSEILLHWVVGLQGVKASVYTSHSTTSPLPGAHILLHSITCQVHAADIHATHKRQQQHHHQQPKRHPSGILAEEVGYTSPNGGPSSVRSGTVRPAAFDDAYPSTRLVSTFWRGCACHTSVAQWKGSVQAAGHDQLVLGHQDDLMLHQDQPWLKPRCINWFLPARTILTPAHKLGCVRTS
eukprot:860256-Pelagomonas_calceolata.AAC.6